ncbi:uncharacterized protein LOC122795068 [Protopterus annectens]|uniref:uncharacterized protein LOC122795068 n=1 Tax=Protopterus annectens TaxID=7888 RepID=UPI001CFB1C1C|nr:uncharacterized protein LOC122795068 [Protopterus annectens]
MSKIIILVCLLAIQLHKGIFWNSAGNEFITAFMENTLSLGFGTELRLVITALSPSTSVNVSIYNTSFNVILSLEENESKPVFIPASAELTGSLIFSNRIIVVTSDKLITILSINNKFDTADSSNIFPVDSLDTDYYVFSPRYKSGMSQFAVINYNQTNIILITLSGDVTYNGQNYQSGDNITVVLSAFEAFQLQSSISLTGTRIQSEYPIAVLSGNSRDYYTNPGSYDYLFEQLLPVKEWGRMFMVSSFAFQNYFDIVTVIASERTEIYYNNGAMSGNISLQQAEHTEINLASSSSLIIKSTKAVMVMYTFTGGLIHAFIGFPFIMNIIPVESFSHTYVISATNLTASYIRIIAKEPVLSGILKENGLSNNQLMNFVNLTEYAWADVALGAINETIVMKYCLPFGAYIYDRIRFIDIGTTALAVNGKPSFLDQPSCETADVTVRSMTNGSVFVNWTKDVCLYSYILTLTKSDNTAVMEEKVVQGSSVVFGGPYASSDYNLTFQAVIEDKKCLPLSKQFTHFDFSWSSAGTEFITAFVQNNDNSNLDVSHLVITALSPSTSVQVIIYNTSFEAALTLGEGETSFVNIPAFAELHGTIFSSNNTVIVRSDKPITVSSFSYKPVTADSADIFPVDILGTEYYVFTPIGGYGMSEVAVINYNQTNELLITVAGALMYNGINYNSGDNITLVLSAFEAIQLQSTTVLTGTRIQSEYRVAVLSGSSCDTYNGTCDDMFEQLLPVNKWGKKFLVAPIAVQGYTDIVTVVASQRTEISYSTGNWSNSTELHQGQSTTISLSSSSSLYLTATEPVMVMYTFTGGNYNGYTAEQFIMNILPFESFSSSYVISTENNFNNYIQLVAKASVISEILQSNNILSNVSIQGNVPMTDFAWANIELGQRNQSFIIKHCSAFAVYMYGTLSFTGFGTTALAMNEFQTCQTSNMTMTYLTDGSVLVTWPNGICVDSYLLQISRPETSIVVKEKMMYGNFTVLTGLQACSVYNSTLWAVFEGEKCLPQMKQFTYFGLQRCKSFNMTVTSMDNGDVLVTWPRVGCVDSYFLQISAHGSYSTLQQQNTYGNSAVFYGLQLCSAYNLTIQTVFQGENCLPLTQQFTHSGTKPCEISNVTLQLNTDGSILVKWTNSNCAESYHVQLLESGSSDVVEEKMVYGNSTVFPGPYARSVYNISILPIIPNEQCLPHVEKFSHSVIWVRL